MRETPENWNEAAARERAGPAYPADQLAGYSYHTGARLRPLGQAEVCPVLFRDLGPVAMGRFLRGELRRLAGLLTPLTYLRTDDYVEPYTDYERIGRLIFLRPLELHPWHAGVPFVYVARATRTADPATVGFVPGDVDLAAARRLALDLPDTRALRDALGGRLYDEAVTDTRRRLEELAAELEQTERAGGPLRQALQAADPRRKDWARETMRRLGIDENDLCAAWHHLPRERRGWMKEALGGLRLDLPG
jgi:hypothetical protein